MNGGEQSERSHLAGKRVDEPTLALCRRALLVSHLRGVVLAVLFVCSLLRIVAPLALVEEELVNRV